jgi:uncharacterized protein (DUF427 family)
MQQHVFSVVGQLRVEPVPTRLRGTVGGRQVLQTDHAVLVWEPHRVVPLYAVPVVDLDAAIEVLDPQPPPPDLSALAPVMGPEHVELHTAPGRVADLVVGDERRAGAAYLLDDADLQGLVLLAWSALDTWSAEDEPLTGHPRDPFKRIDVLTSSRRVRVSLAGTVLAESDRALLLVETPIPGRWYLPAEDVRMDLLVPSDTVTTCAYKGDAAYFSTADGSEAGRDIAWTYREPLDDALRVRDHVCFFMERTDLEVDGVRVPRPVTPWSDPEERDAQDGSAFA